MCGCEQHSDPTAECTCICTEHGNFNAAVNLARSRWDTITEMQTMTEDKIMRCLEEYDKHSWSPRFRLCDCGMFFEARLEGQRLHARHRMIHTMRMIHTLRVDEPVKPADADFNSLAQYLYEEMSASPDIEFNMSMTSKRVLVRALKKATERLQ